MAKAVIISWDSITCETVTVVADIPHVGDVGNEGVAKAVSIALGEDAVAECDRYKPVNHIDTPQLHIIEWKLEEPEAYSTSTVIWTDMMPNDC